jgi:hypothetical protein
MASSATFEKIKSYQLPLFSIQGIYKSDYSQLNRKRLILRSIGGPEPALRHSGERDKGKTHHAEAGGASWGIVGRLRGLFTRSAAGWLRMVSKANIWQRDGSPTIRTELRNRTTLRPQRMHLSR